MIISFDIWRLTGSVKRSISNFSDKLRTLVAEWLKPTKKKCLLAKVFSRISCHESTTGLMIMEITQFTCTGKSLDDQVEIIFSSLFSLDNAVFCVCVCVCLLARPVARDYASEALLHRSYSFHSVHRLRFLELTTKLLHLCDRSANSRKWRGKLTNRKWCIPWDTFLLYAWNFRSHTNSLRAFCETEKTRVEICAGTRDFMTQGVGLRRFLIWVCANWRWSPIVHLPALGDSMVAWYKSLNVVERQKIDLNCSETSYCVLVSQKRSELLIRKCVNKNDCFTVCPDRKTRVINGWIHVIHVSV